MGPRTVLLVAPAGPPWPECEAALARAARAGTAVRRVAGDSPADRDQAACDALAEGFDELVWVGPDIVFEAADIARLRGHGLPLVCGLYPNPGARELACEFLPGAGPLALGRDAPPAEVKYAGLRFAYTRRDLYDALRGLPGLAEVFHQPGRPLVPYFAPLTVRDGGRDRYLAGDDAFCERVRLAGLRVVADPAVRLWRVAPYRYGWEDAGGGPERFERYRLLPPGDPALPAGPTGPAPAGGAAPGSPRLGSASDRGGDGRPAGPLRPPATPLAAGFPRLGAYVVTYERNLASAGLTLDDFRRSDWGAEPAVFVQPTDWPVGFPAAARNYRRALERAAADGCDFALLLEDDVRVCRRLRHNLTALPLVRRDQCDFLSLYMPDLIRSPWEREEPHLGYRLARPLYAGPNAQWVKYRLWGSQAYLLSRRLVLAALARWDRLKDGIDTRVISVCSELAVPMWYTTPCLVDHAPLRSAHDTPLAHAPDFDHDCVLEVGPGFQPPEAVPGWLEVDEAELLWQAAAGRDVLELGTGAGRATVCLAQRARRVVSVGGGDFAEAAEWVARYGAAGRVEFRRGGAADAARGPAGEFGLVFVDSEHDAAGVARDIAAALARLAPGGLLAFHDYPDPAWPDVRRVVDEAARRLGWKRVAQAGYLGVFRT